MGGEPSPPREYFAVRGRVLDAGGAPASGVGVAVVRVWEGGWDLYRGPDCFTDAGGQFVRDQLPVGGAQIALFPPQGDPVAAVEARPVMLFGPFAGRAGDDVDAGDLRLGAPGGWIEGGVVDEAGVPVEGAQVRVSLGRTGLSERWVRTDASGAFRVDGLLPGRYSLRASHQHPERGWLHGAEDGAEPGQRVFLELLPASAVLLRFHSAGDQGTPVLVRRGFLQAAGSPVIHGFGASPTPTPVAEWRVLLSPGVHRLRFQAAGFRPLDLGEVNVYPRRVTEVVVPLERDAPGK
jgi:hypothetical protein